MEGWRHGGLAEREKGKNHGESKKLLTGIGLLVEGPCSLRPLFSCDGCPDTKSREDRRDCNKSRVGVTKDLRGDVFSHLQRPPTGSHIFMKLYGTKAFFFPSYKPWGPGLGLSGRCAA
jgi:hypothetical protein